MADPATDKKGAKEDWRETHAEDSEWLPATDEEFDRVEAMVRETEGWELHKTHDTCQVFLKKTDMSKALCLKVTSDKLFEHVRPEVLFDVLEDPDYRHVWDESCIECTSLVRIDARNEVNYYSAHCPAPLSNRDWCNRFGATIRRVEGEEAPKYILFNRSVLYPPCPPKKGFERATSFVTAYFVEPLHPADAPETTGSRITYITHNDWNGWIPSSIVNMCMKSMIPSVLKQLLKACLAYPEWKAQHNPDDKPWLK